ncbi:unnamed protein product [Chrysoparadoxa australica]
MAAPYSGDTKRGLFVLFEGVDRCGKSTQSQLLVDSLKGQAKDAVLMRFPDRTTTIGKMINSYLQNAAEMDDRCIHLLFSANRWEAASTIEAHLSAGRTVVCDRYAYSGVAFSASKDGLTRSWCKQPDVGLPAPDMVIYLDIPVEDAMKRGQFGEERYEKESFQRIVRDNFMMLRDEDIAQGKQWHVIDARDSIEDIRKVG